MDNDQFLAAGEFINSGAPNVIDFAKRHAAGAKSARAAAVQLYAAVRDGITYDPYVDLANPDNYRASGVLSAQRGFCIGKAALLAACARVIGIPSRVGYADVRNHLTSPRLFARIKTDIFRWHSYADLFLSDRWVKATPAFDLSLCKRLDLKPLEFDGKTDALLQAFDRMGRRHMEYLNDRGTFADVPLALIKADFLIAYPDLMRGAGLSGDFALEATNPEMEQ